MRRIEMEKEMLTELRSIAGSLKDINKVLSAWKRQMDNEVKAHERLEKIRVRDYGKIHTEPILPEGD